MEERLKKFAKVVESGSLTRAAAELHISQPALSTALAKLERELGAELLERGRHPLKPTRAGQAAYRHAKNVQVQNANFRQELTALANDKPCAAIGMIDSIAGALFAHDQLKKLEERASISLSINNSRYLLRTLERGELDIIFIAKPAESPPKNLHLSELGDEPLVAVTHPGRLKNARQTLQNKLLPDFINYDQKSNTSRLIRAHFAAKGIELQPIFHSTSPHIILRMVLAGRGWAVLPYMDVRAYLEKGELAQIAGPIPRPMIALQHENRRLPAAISELKTAAGQVLQHVNTVSNSA